MRALAVLVLAGCGRIAFDPVSEPSDACVAAAPQIQTGELVIDSASTMATVAMSVPLDRSILFVTIREAEPSPSYGNTMCELVMDGLICRRLQAGTDYAMSTGTIAVRWTVVTFEAGVSVQRGVANLTVTRPAIVPVTPVDTSSSFLVLTGGFMNSGGSWGTDEFIRARVVDAQTLELTALALGSEVGWQLVTMAGASVQRGMVDFANADVMIDIPISPVDVVHTFALASWTEDSSVRLGASLSMVDAALGPMDLMLQRAAGGAPVSASWEVVTVPYTVDHTLFVMAAGDTMKATPSVGPGAVAFASGMSVLGTSGGQSFLSAASVNPDLVGEATATFAVTPDGIVVQRASSLATASWLWNELDFGSCR